MQRHRNADNLKSPQETQAPPVEKKSKKPKKKEKKHKEKEREKEKRKERERKTDEDDKKVLASTYHIIYNSTVEVQWRFSIGIGAHKEQWNVANFKDSDIIKTYI